MENNIDLGHELTLESINVHNGKLESLLSDISKILTAISNDKTIAKGYRALLKDYILQIEKLK